MDEAGCCEPRADKNGEQIHQLDGITVQKRQKSKMPKLQKTLLGVGSRVTAPL